MKSFVPNNRYSRNFRHKLNTYRAPVQLDQFVELKVINYTPRTTTADYNGPLSWCGKAEGKDTEKYFCGEISELRSISNLDRFHHFKRGERLRVRNTKNDREIIFECFQIDSSDGGEDIAGWRFKSVQGSDYPVEMLIIND